MIAPLDLQTLFVSVLSGSWFIFAGIALLCIVGMAAYFKMSNLILGLIVLVFAAIMALYLQWLWILVAIIAAFVIVYSIIRIFKS